MNTNITQPSGPECARYAPLMPQVRHEESLESSVARSVQAHLEHCPFCQAQLATYDRLDARLRSYAHRSASSAPAPDAIIQAALAASSTLRTSDTARRQRERTAPPNTRWSSDSPLTPPVPREVRPMRFTRQRPLLATTAAILVIVLAAALFATIAHLRPGPASPHNLPTSTPLTATATTTATATRAITAQQAWGANAATLTLDTQLDTKHVFQASAISPDGKLLLGYETPIQGGAGAQQQAGYFDIATRHFTAIGLSQPWPEPPVCCQTDGRFLLVVLDSAPGVTCGLCHLNYYSYDMVSGQVWQIAKGSDYEIVNMTYLDHGFVLLSTGQGLVEANLAMHTVAHLPLPTTSPDIHVVAFAWPHLVYTVPSQGSSTPATHAYNLMTRLDAALPQLDTLQAKGGIGAAVTSDTLFITQTTNIDATHATTTLFEDDAFLTLRSAPPHALATYNDQLGIVARTANTRLVAFYGTLVWDRVEQRFVTIATDGQQAGEVSVVLSGHFLAVIQTNNTSGTVMPQHVTIYDTNTLPTAPSP